MQLHSFKYSSLIQILSENIYFPYRRDSNSLSGHESNGNKRIFHIPIAPEQESLDKFQCPIKDTPFVKVNVI